MSDLDLDRLNEWLRRNCSGIGAVEGAKKFDGGQSNPTYLLTTNRENVVLRRKPLGTLLKSAHAIDREFRVQGALRDTSVPVPAMYALCEDEAVLGSSFFIMEHVSGRCIDDPRLPSVPVEERHQYFNEMCRVLAAIHEVDLERCKLTDYGPTGNYFQRQIERWTKQYRASETEQFVDMDRLMALVAKACPRDDGQVSLVHGDFRIDNLLFHLGRAQILAVLDWELSTIGHPYADLASVIMQWQMPPGSDGRGLRGVDRQEEGLMPDEEFIATYCMLRGINPIENFGFYLAFCFFRMAAILQGVKKRAVEGNASNAERGLQLGRFVPLYAKAGLEALG